MPFRLWGWMPSVSQVTPQPQAWIGHDLLGVQEGIADVAVSGVLSVFLAVVLAFAVVAPGDVVAAEQ